MQTKFLLGCGLISTILYVAMNVFLPSRFEGYDIASQTISELSALGAPTRVVWVWLAMAYVALFGLFGIGILRTSGGNWLLYIVAYLVFAYTVINFYWPPVHLRGATASLSDKLHIVWAIMTITVMMLIMGFAMMALGRSFRIYTMLTFLVFVVFGVLTFTEAPNIERNLPTPHIGIWERINVGAFMTWVFVFSISLLRRESARPAVQAFERTKVVVQ